MSPDNEYFRGCEGVLKTTQDLFTQAEYFAEEANRLYKVVRQFSYQVSVPSRRAEPEREGEKRRISTRIDLTCAFLFSVGTCWYA